MRIEGIVYSEFVEEKLWVKHHVTIDEVEQVFSELPQIRFAEKGYTKGEDVYFALGRTSAGRYLTVFFINKLSEKTALIISARDMNNRERRTYEKK